MRSAILAMTLAAGCMSNQDQPTPSQSLPADAGPGRVAWFDITTTNLDQSKAFYAGLFGWEFTSMKGAEKLAAEIVSGGQPVGTLRVAEGKISPYDGVVYIQVKDMTASCAKAKEFGGTIPPGFPFNLNDDRGAVGLVIDPAGHPIGMYSRTSLPAPAK